MTCNSPRLLLSATSRLLLVKKGSYARNSFSCSYSSLRVGAGAVVKPPLPPPCCRLQRLFSSSSSGLPPGIDELQRERESMQSHSPFNLATEVDTLKPNPPDFIDAETLDILQTTMDLYMKRGIAFQQIDVLARSGSGNNKDWTLLRKWQKMMEIYLLCQLQVLSPLGYKMDHEGLRMFAVHCQQMMDRLQDKDSAQFLHLKHQKRSTYRYMISKVFGVNLEELPELDIVQARDHVHATTSKMQSPEILMQIQKTVARIYNSDPGMEQAMKHHALQEIIINHVYLGGDQLLVRLGYPEGEKGYASYQCCIADYDEEPLIQEYTNAAMKKLYQAAGLDVQAG